MKVLFVYPPARPISIEQPGWNCAAPYCFELLAATLKPRHAVQLWDLRVEGDLFAALDRYGPDVVGVTGYTKHCRAMLECFRQTKRYDPSIRTVAGGIHATLKPEDFHHNFVDAIMIGEDRQRFRQVVDAWEDGTEIEAIGGLHFRKSQSWHRSEAPLPQIDLDAYPRPDHSICEPYEDSYRTSFANYRFIRTSLGCPYRCNFCSVWKFVENGRYYKRSPASVAQELLDSPYHEYFLADDEAFLDFNRMFQMAQTLQDLGIKRFFHTECRSDTICRHPELIEKWRDVGLAVLTVGLESFNDADLSAFNKRTTVSTNVQAIRHLNRLGVVTHGCIIVRQDWMEEDFKRTYQSIVETFDECPLFVPSFSVLTPFPGTELYEDVKGSLITENYNFFDGYHSVLPTALPLEIFYDQFYELYANTWQHVGKHPKWTENIRAFARDDFWPGLRRRMQDHESAGHLALHDSDV